MKDKIFRLTAKIVGHELVSGSSFLFIGTTIANICAFLFVIFLARHLSKVNYAEIVSLLTLITYASTPAQAFLPTIVQFATKFFVRNQKGHAQQMYWQSSRQMGIVAAMLMVGFFILAPFIGNFLHIKNTFEIILAGFVVAVIYLSTSNIAFLQSFMRFGFLAFTTGLGGILKLFVGAGAILVGFGLNGILMGYFLSFLIPLLLNFIPLRDFFIKKTKVEIHQKEIFTYGLSTAGAVFSLFSFTLTDILLVKHFLSSSDAALYSGFSTLGKIIFYFSAPITSVMFPLVIKRVHNNQDARGLLYASFLLVLLPSLLLTIIYFSFPRIIISLILGNQYVEGASLLGWFGLYLCVFSLLNIIVNFLLSIKKTTVSYMVVVGAIMQVIGISIFHASVMEVVIFSLILSLVLFVILLLYYQHIYYAKKIST